MNVIRLRETEMRETFRWGIMIGVVSAAVAWLGQLLSSGKAVSLFPDLLALVILSLFTRCVRFARRVTPQNATLASSWVPPFAGQDSDLSGSLRKVSDSVRAFAISSSFPFPWLLGAQPTSAQRLIGLLSRLSRVVRSRSAGALALTWPRSGFAVECLHVVRRYYHD